MKVWFQRLFKNKWLFSFKHFPTKSSCTYLPSQSGQNHLLTWTAIFILSSSSSSPSSLLWCHIQLSTFCVLCHHHFELFIFSSWFLPARSWSIVHAFISIIESSLGQTEVIWPASQWTGHCGCFRLWDHLVRLCQHTAWLQSRGQWLAQWCNERS